MALEKREPGRRKAAAAPGKSAAPQVITPMPFPGESPTVLLALAASRMYGLHDEEKKPARAPRAAGKKKAVKKGAAAPTRAKAGTKKPRGAAAKARSGTAAKTKSAAKSKSPARGTTTKRKP